MYRIFVKGENMDEIVNSEELLVKKIKEVFYLHSRASRQNF